MNTNLKRAIVGLALLFSMGMANATTTNIGDLTTYGIGGYSATVVLGKGIFSDIYNFSIPSTQDVSGYLLNQNTRNLLNITDLSLTLKDSLNNPLQTSLNFDMFLSPGSYSFTVDGNATGTFGGKYYFNAATLPVPEPSTWAMMLGGLGLIGFMSYRRRQYL